MRRAALTCTEVQVLFYEAEGLLLTAGLLPVDPARLKYLLIFQLSYLGCGEISVHVGLHQRDSDSATPEYAAVDLLGTARGRVPNVWMTSVAVREEGVNCRLTVWGQPGPDDPLRGELVAEICGRLPVLSASSRASVTHAVMPPPSDFPGVGQASDWEEIRQRLRDV